MSHIAQEIIFNTRNAWQSLAYSPLGATVLPPSKTKPCLHLANVQRMPVVSVCLYYGKLFGCHGNIPWQIGKYGTASSIAIWRPYGFYISVICIWVTYGINMTELIWHIARW